MQTSGRSQTIIGAVIGLAAVAFAGLSYAQTVFDEEIVVTARKIEENPQDVPISISAFSQQTIRDLNVNNIDEIALFTPGLSYNSAFGRQPGSDRASMRGVTTIVNGAANASSVATFVDGVYVGGTTQQTELFNLERVEVLRGPQSAQFGRGTYAGAINYITRGPSDEFEGDVRATAGENDEYRISSWISGPLFGDFGFYASAGYDTFDGDYTNRKIGDTANTLGRELGDDIGGEETKGITGKLFWDPTDKLSVTFKLGYQETDDDHFPIYLQNRFAQTRNNDPSLDPVTPVKINNCCERTSTAPRAREYYIGNGSTAGPVQLNTDILDQVADSGVQIDRKIAALTLDWDLDWWILDGTTFSSLTGYVDDEINQALDVTYGGYEAFLTSSLGVRGAFNQIDDDSQEDFSQEFRLTSNQDQRLRWAGGLYYWRGETKENRDERAYVDDDPANSVPDGTVVRANQFWGFGGLDRTRVINKAAFGSLSYDIFDNLEATAELRYAVDEVKVRSLNYPTAPGFTGGPFADRLRQQNDFESLTPRFTLTWGLTEDVNLYANIAKGTKPGDFNTTIPDKLVPDPADPTGPPIAVPDESKRFVDEEEAWNYEIGMKSTWFDGRALFNIAGYYFDIEDQQLTQNVSIGTQGLSSSFLDTAGETQVWGLETEGSMLFGDYLTVGFSYAYTDSEFDEYVNQDQADLRGSDGTVAQNEVLGDVSGFDSPRVPEHMFSFTSRYERPLGRDGSWFISADYAWEDSKYAQVHNLIETGERSDLRAQAGVSWGSWSLVVWGKNLTEDESAVDIIRYVDRSRATLGSQPPDQPGLLEPCPDLDPTAICTATSPSTSPRGFGVTLPRKRQFGATVTYKFGGGN